MSGPVSTLDSRMSDERVKCWKCAFSGAVPLPPVHIRIPLRLLCVLTFCVVSIFRMLPVWLILSHNRARMEAARFAMSIYVYSITRHPLYSECAGLDCLSFCQEYDEENHITLHLADQIHVLRFRFHGHRIRPSTPS